jgi:hypothetical protein
MDGPDRALPPPAVIMQMMTAAWISQTISAVTRLDVPDLLEKHGATTARATKFLDMLMMVSLPGKERTEAEWRSLYERANLRVTSIRVMNPRSGESLIEGVAGEFFRSR